MTMPTLPLCPPATALEADPDFLLLDSVTTVTSPTAPASERLMFLVVFRNRKRAEIDEAAYAADAGAMEALAARAARLPLVQVLHRRRWRGRRGQRMGRRSLGARLGPGCRTPRGPAQGPRANTTPNTRCSPAPTRASTASPRRERMTIHLYGIPNCDTVKKARAWLDANGARLHLPRLQEGRRRPGPRARLGRRRSAGRRCSTGAAPTFRKLEPAQKADSTPKRRSG